VCTSAGKVNGVRTRGSDEEDKGSSNDEETENTAYGRFSYMISKSW
jgi:hypothetical protein